MLQKISAIIKDELFWRVMTFMTGLFFLTIPILALIFNVLHQNSDTALMILLEIFAAFGLLLSYAAIFGNTSLLEKASVWMSSGEIIFILGLITFAIPITIAIQFMQKRKQDALK